MSNSRISLEKGGRINLAKEAPGLTKVRLDLSWDPNSYDTGAEWDLDVSVFACAPNAAGEPKMVTEDYMLFYNSCYRSVNGAIVEDLGPYPKKGHPATPCGGLVHTGDNRSGKGEGPDESIKVDFSKLDPRVTEISVIVTIHDAAARKQNFGQVKNSAIKLYNDATGEEIAVYALEDDFSTETAVHFGSLYKKDGAWLFKAFGAGFKKGLSSFVEIYSA